MQREVVAEPDFGYDKRVRLSFVAHRIPERDYIQTTREGTRWGGCA